MIYIILKSICECIGSIKTLKYIISKNFNIKINQYYLIQSK